MLRGKVVQLLSGGPLMTVTGSRYHIREDYRRIDFSTCQWFTDGVLHKAEFFDDTLLIQEPKP